MYAWRMRVVRTLAVAADAAWVALGLLVTIAAVASGIGPSLAFFMLLLIAPAATSAVVILRQVRGERVGRALRLSASVLSVAWLFLATIGWTTAITGGPGPSSVASALLPALLTVMVIVNLSLILARSIGRPSPEARASG